MVWTLADSDREEMDGKRKPLVHRMLVLERLPRKCDVAYRHDEPFDHTHTVRHTVPYP